MDRAKFFATLRTKVGRLSPVLVKGFESVLDAADGAPLAHQAYMLATAYWETNKTMLPVREAYWLSEEWRRKNLRYYPWYGRGYVQITWQKNYAKADKELGLGGKLLLTPDMAMEPEIAARIMRLGMDQGWFTGKSLKTYLPMSGVATREQYLNARKIINGTDKDDEIEDFAQIFERCLRDGGLV